MAQETLKEASESQYKNTLREQWSNLGVIVVPSENWGDEE
jgi:hypothetical protein